MVESKDPNKRRVFVVGNGSTRYYKPGAHDFDYHDLGKLAIERALRDAAVKFEQLEAAYTGWVYGDSCSGQKCVYQVGNTGIPIINSNDNGATGGAALYMAWVAIHSGQADCVLGLGFEKMYAGPLKENFSDRASPTQLFLDRMDVLRGKIKDNSTYAVRWFASGGKEHSEKYGTKLEHFAKIAAKNHRHASNNKNALHQKVYTVDEIMKAPMIHWPETILSCCPNSDGASAAILVSEDFVRKHGLEDQAVEINHMSLTTDTPKTFNGSMADLIGGDMCRRAAKEVYERTGVTPQQVDVCELHDCFASNELLTYEHLGFCEVGKAGEAIDRDEFTYGGKVVVNPSGGLIAKGHPLGATGFAQCAELCW